ncbi:MAG: pantoate--beta-alanine ligase [Bacteroidetes bacterium]|nr:pantoate--beta-alanine ligase [Bacteroidota bacterium]MBU1679415.1 pantoate--beta-alanine ligase [Bacteroidota bacterium]MBU2506813.1 pantoate--beta-alanine ligase [Bacteroidota bacterium]
MKVIKSPAELKAEIQSLSGSEVGFVPTMGALHEGHLHLIQRARSENQFVVVSIFINPTQFNEKEDLKKYPVQLNKDLYLLDNFGVDFVFIPDYESLYPDDFTYRIEETNFSRELCGASRDGHFTGVLTVVMKLLNIVKPQRAYFGEKDRQQLILIQRMVTAFFLDVKIVACSTVREKDGLAMSSRNLRLTKDERKIVKYFPELLMSNKSDAELIPLLRRHGFKIDYIETKNNIRYGAVFLRNIRLIDNVKI